MKRLRKFGKQVMIALLLVSLNINPIGTVAGAIYSSGLVDRVSNLGQRLYAMSDNSSCEVHAEDGGGPSSSGISVTCSCSHQTIPISGGQVLTYDKNNFNVNRTSMERLGHISGKMDNLIEEVIVTRNSMIDGFNKVIYQLELVNEKLDVILRSLHHYRVAHVYSLNNHFGTALYRPHVEDVPYIEDYITVTGQFANIYTGYWDANVANVINPYPAERALEVLGYDAILRYEGVHIIDEKKLEEKDISKLHSPDSAYGESTLSSSYQLKHIPTEEELKAFEELPEEMKEVYGIHPENNTVPVTGDIVRLDQKFIPEENITWLDAVTVLYKALDQPVWTYQSFFTRNREITPENSPLSQNLSGVKEFDGFDYYVFTTRNNCVEGDGHTTKINYVYWVKAINDGVVSWEDRDKPITAWEFYGLATTLMQAYGEPVMNDDEIKALLQVYGDEYPVQLGTEIADDWAYLKARGVLSKDLNLDISDNMSRNQLLDICMRIKDKTAREDYKTIQISLDIGQLMRDNGYYPVYDLDWGVNEFDISTIIDYEAMTDYTYLLSAPDDMPLNTIGYGAIYSEPKFDESKIIKGAYYNGKIKIDGKYYFRVSVPKSYTKNFYLGFTHLLDETQRNGDADFIEVTSANLGGGIYTAYTIKDKIATVDKAVEGKNYFKFNHRAEDKALRQFADKDRCKVSTGDIARVSYGVSVNADPFSKLVAFIDEMTSPMVVMAADDTDDKSWKKSITLYGSISEEGIEGYKVYDPVADFIKTKTIGGNDIATDGSELLVPTKPLATSLSRFSTVDMYYKATPYDPAKFIGGRTPHGLYHNWFDTEVPDGWKTSYGLGLGDQKKFAELNPSNDTNVFVSSSANVDELDTILTHLEKADVHGPYIGADKGKVLYDVTGKNRTDVDAMLDALVNVDDIKSGADTLEDSEDAWKELEYDVTTDTIMSRDENLLIAWSALKDAGLAWSISKTSDNYTYDEKNGTYSFMTSCGSVLINEIYQYMQVGTTLYTFQNGDKPANLVYVDPDLSEDGYQEVYFDVRCVLGMVNRRFEAIGNTKVVEQTKQASLAIGGDAEYSLNPGQLVGLGSAEIFGQKQTTISNWPDVPLSYVQNSGIATYNTNIILNTVYDNLEVGPTSGSKYWPTGTEGVRISMSHFNPTSNYILVVSDMGDENTTTNNGISAGLFVYYPRKAFIEGVDDDGDGEPNGAIDGTTWSIYFDKQYQTACKNLAASQYSNNKSTLDGTVEAYSKGYGDYKTIDQMASTGKWYDKMTAAAIVDLFAYTGRIYIESDYVIRKFDLTDNFLAGVVKSQSLSDPVPDDKPTIISPNEPGYMYWVPNIGYVYNMPDVKDFKLSDYYKGKYLLPMASSSSGVITYNLNYYGAFKPSNGGDYVDVPLGWELTNLGYVHYKTEEAMSAKPYPNNSVVGEETAPFDVSKFVPAPSGVFTRYGIWRQDDIHSIAAENLTSAYTISEAVYYGSRRIYSADMPADEDGFYTFRVGCTNWNPIAIPGKTKAYISMQSQGSSGRLFASYVMPRTSMIENVGDVLENINEIPIYSEDEVSWAGKVKLESFLDSIDKGTSMLLYITFVIAPMLCVIWMTILIGISFMTDNKVWLMFCDKCFDPVYILTFHARTSQEWRWNRVLIPCIITYVAFALFANANILKILIWIIDAWVKITAYIK